METPFLKTVTRYQREINKETASFFDREIKGAHAPFLAQTLRALKEFSLRPAKRIRAILVIYGYLLAGGRNKKKILKTSVFIELIHNFLLIHDDIIDRETIRRGKTALHHHYEKLGIQEKEHYGLSMALAAGDMMEMLAKKILTQTKVSPANMLEAQKKLEEVLMRTIYGEMFEVELKKYFLAGKKIQEKDVMDVYRNKTAFYTLVGPLQMGMLLAGGGAKHLDFAKDIGFPLGIAYQINDDLEDASGSDVKEGQPNLLITRAMAGKQGSALKKFLGKTKASKDSAKNIQKILLESDAIDYCTSMAQKLTRKAKQHIASSQYQKGYKEFFMGLADYLERKS